MPRTTGPRFVADGLRGYGVTHVFFVPQMLLETLTGMEGMGIRRVMVHGEKAAAYMADGYARASGRPGICMAQHVGASNLAAGLRDAYLACSPVIAMTGGPAPAARYRHAYQEIEDFTQFDYTTKLNARVDHIARLPDMLRQAFREATTGAPGPVHLQIGGHHAEAVLVEADLTLRIEDEFKQVPAYRPAADASHVTAALRLLAAAERPIIVAGGGVAWSNAQADVVALAERLSVPVATSLNAKGAMLDTHPLAVGVVGTYSRACANRAVGEADLVFFVGSHTGSQVTARWQVPKPGTPVIQLDIDAREIGRNYPTQQALLGDARTVLRQMLDAATKDSVGKRAPWLARVRQLVEEWRASVADKLNSDAIPMRPERVCLEITRVLPENAVLVSDTGHSGIWTGAMVEFARPGQRFIRCAGSLGWGFPGALGVKCALPDTPVVCFAGDGGFYYHLAELETAARYGINLVVVVNNNGALNQEIPHFDRAYGGDPDERGREMWGFSQVNFANVAESLGCVGMRVEKPADMAPAIERALAAGRPVVIDTVTDHRAFSPKTWTGGAGDGH
ncbi:MAG: thiamine pyrophosphate-binding protein [Betaproteobacteria bacterium]|nr:thiamine pyrophosphate-binding protein [Betaproteobacteria bacterium]MDH3438751.1 thiamine pyrophosphate-binding protein [Betaproteobacteria bacterium]